MKQPTITLNGKRYPVTDVWWNDDGKVDHIYVHELRRCIFHGDYDLEKMLKEG